MLFKSFVSAALAATALAQPVQHQHHQHDKKAVVVTNWNTVVVTATAGAAPAAQPTQDAEANAAAAVGTTLATRPSPVASSSSSSGSGSSPASSSSDSVSVPSSSGSFSGPAKGITYSPYSDDGGCKSASQIKSEVSKLSGYEVIRLYGVDCNQVEATLSGLSSGQKIFAGIFDVDNIESGVETLAKAVKNHGGWDVVHTVSIGNELVNAGSATPDQIGKYIESGRSALKAQGYNGPVVSVDTFIAVINNPDLCKHSDYMAVNAHAFFDGYVSAKEAGDWALLQLQRVSNACGDSKKVFITETGWPTKGDSNNVAVPSKENQKAALDSISAKCGSDATFFNAYNDMWKQPGPYNAEQYWGVYSS